MCWLAIYNGRIGGVYHHEKAYKVHAQEAANLLVAAKESEIILLIVVEHTEEGCFWKVELHVDLSGARTITSTIPAQDKDSKQFNSPIG
jgi:hypothetical protein